MAFCLRRGASEPHGFFTGSFDPAAASFEQNAEGSEFIVAPALGFETLAIFGSAAGGKTRPPQHEAPAPAAWSAARPCAAAPALQLVPAAVVAMEEDDELDEGEEALLLWALPSWAAEAAEPEEDESARLLIAAGCCPVSPPPKVLLNNPQLLW